MTTPDYYTTPFGDLYDLWRVRYGKDATMAHMEMCILEYVWRASAKGQYVSDMQKVLTIAERLMYWSEGGGQPQHAPTVPLSLDDMATHLSAAGYLVRGPDENLEPLLGILACTYGYGLIPPNGPAPHDAWPPADHPVEPPLPAEDLAARLTKVTARLNGHQTDEDTLLTRAVKAWQHRHGQEIGKSAGAGATLKADLQSALQAAHFYNHAMQVDRYLYTDHSMALDEAGLGAWFALEDAAPPAPTPCPEETVLEHCLAADIARQGVAVESEIRALLAKHAIEPHLAYVAMARVLAQCEPERWPDTTGQAVQG